MESSHITVKSAGAHSAKHNISKPTSTSTPEKNHTMQLLKWRKKHMTRHSTNDQICLAIWWGPTFSQLSIYNYSWIMMHTLFSGITRFWAKWQGRCFHVLWLCIAESAILLSNPQWREATSLQRVRELIQRNRTLEKTPPHTHWRKTIQVPTMQLLKWLVQCSQTTHDLSLIHISEPTRPY